jgi:2,3-bisphosphoglycerate-independent phosphoglycerate mutase
VTRLKNLFIATMTQYDETFSADVAFPNETVEHPLGKVLADDGKIQLRIAETEKYAHVTYFFNGLNEKPYKNEYRVLIPSEHSSKPEEFPEMRASAITDRALIALNEGRFDFILLNYANPDIIAHTGNYEATILAVKAVDGEIDRLAKAALEGGHILCITSDHGNAEVVLDPQTGQVETKHNVSPVPFYLVGKRFERRIRDINPFKLQSIGLLSDVAPTILDLMKLRKPDEMTGQSLLPQLL